MRVNNDQSTVCPTVGAKLFRSKIDKAILEQISACGKVLIRKIIEHNDLVTGEKALEDNKLRRCRRFTTLSLIVYPRLKIMNN